MCAFLDCWNSELAAEDFQTREQDLLSMKE